LASLSPLGARRGRVPCQNRAHGPLRGRGRDPNRGLCCCLLCSCRTAGKKEGGRIKLGREEERKVGGWKKRREERRNEKGRKEGRMIVERRKGKGKGRIKCLLKFLE
jgi:hypothetical protein